VSSRAPCDVLVIGHTTLHGWLDADSLEMETRYGKFTLDLRTVAAINLAKSGPPEAARLLTLASGERVQIGADSGALEFDSGFGPLKVPLDDVTTMSLDAASKQWSLETAKMSLTGTLTSKEFDVETGLGRLAIPVAAVSGMRSVNVPKRE
jgi:hypothetical protein